MAGENNHANWWHAAAAISLAQLYLAKGDAVRADAALEKANRLDVYDARSVSFRAAIKMEENRLAEAYRLQRQAIDRQPQEPGQYLMLSDILIAMGRADEARATLALVEGMRATAASQAASR
ncbi:hypothetical protein BH20VER1_BH20VER1_26800 [soil metagenome]